MLEAQLIMAAKPTTRTGNYSLPVPASTAVVGLTTVFFIFLFFFYKYM